MRNPGKCHYEPSAVDKCRSKDKMASFLGRDFPPHRTRFSSRTTLKDRLLGPHSLLSDGLLVAFLWASLLVSSDLVSGKTTAIRRVQNLNPHGYSLWSPSKEAPEFDYLVEGQPDEDDEEEEPPPRRGPLPPLPPRLNQRQPPLYHRRPDPTFDPARYYGTPSDEPRPSPPRAIPFGGRFHISSDQFVPFEPNDARVSQTPGEEDQTTHPNPSFRPPSRTAPFVTPVDSFVPSKGSRPLQHAALARPGKVREIVRFATETTTPLDDSALYYRPPAPTTTTPKPTYVVVPEDAIEVSFSNLSKPGTESRQPGKTEEEGGSLGDEPDRPDDNPTYFSQPGSDSGSPAVHQKRWRDGTASTYLKSTIPPSRTKADLTEVYYPSEFTSQTPYWTTSSSRMTSTVGVGNGPSEDAFAPVRYVNWSTPADEDEEDESPPPRATTDTTVPRREISSSAKPNANKDGLQSRPLSTGAIAGIAIGILAPLALVAGAMAYLLYGRHFKNVAHKADGRSIAERGSYIDDSVRPSGYMNSHIELPKESSEEMTSLDNDSFLNSLEAVTIQNYWAESAKNTKV